MQIIGHRGAPGYPRRGENTIHSFKKALSCGANAIEFDVRKTADEKLVVLHDATLNRTTDGTGKVAELCWSDVSLYNAGDGWHEPTPLLADVFSKIGDPCFLHIELKDGSTAREVAALIRAWNIQSRTCVSCSDGDDCDPGASSSWQDLSCFFPDIPIALIASEHKISRIGIDAFLETARHLSAWAVHPEHMIVDRDFVAKAVQKNIRVNAWTVNDPVDIARCKRIGVAGIISDFPERI